MRLKLKYGFILITINLIALSAFSQTPSSIRIPASQLDYESQYCMRCHDGSAGKTIELRPVNAPLEFDRGLWMRTKNHSIGMSYSESENNNPREYVPAGALDPNIKLVDGKIGCLSCHVAKPQLLASLSLETNSESNECSVDIEGTKKAFQGNLCIYCHRK
ncbi:MAG: hypothetical protein C0417_07085 [Chlorobiaceae bacterium]|nr:hypothetical protein [Chlorobiaceae bacterium]